jgi:hypothetical protein
MAKYAKCFSKTIVIHKRTFRPLNGLQYRTKYNSGGQSFSCYFTNLLLFCTYVVTIFLLFKWVTGYCGVTITYKIR